MRLLSVDARAVGESRGVLAELIESAQADVACVHGGPHLLRWRSIAAAIGRRSGLVVVTGGRPAGANLLLSSLAVDVLATADLDVDGGLARRHAGAALGALRLRDASFLLVAATLVGDAAKRSAQAEELSAAITALSAQVSQVTQPLPAIVCVRGAARPGTSTWQALVQGRTGIGGRVFVDEPIRVAQCRELDGYAHFDVPPIVLDLDLDGL